MGFGRQMLFFKCADRTERRVCTEAQLLENLETFYGSESDEETAERIAAIGLPEDKYDAAAIPIAVIQNSQSEEEKFVERFIGTSTGTVPCKLGAEVRAECERVGFPYQINLSLRIALQCTHPSFRPLWKDF